MTDRARGHLKWLTLAYASALVLLVIVADRGSLMISYLASLPAFDKIAHFLLMGFLSYLANTALGCRRLRSGRASVLMGSLLVGVVVTAEEVSQLWMIHRAFDLADLAADLAGIWVFGRIALALER